MNGSIPGNGDGISADLILWALDGSTGSFDDTRFYYTRIRLLRVHVGALRVRQPARFDEALNLDQFSRSCSVKNSSRRRSGIGSVGISTASDLQHTGPF